MARKTVGIRVLKNRLSAYVRKVADSGEAIVITDRGHPVARLSAIDEQPPATRPAMRVRQAVKDHSDLSWMQRRLPERGSKLRSDDVARALDFVREDASLP